MINGRLQMLRSCYLGVELQISYVLPSCGYERGEGDVTPTQFCSSRLDSFHRRDDDRWFTYPSEGRSA